VKLGARVRLKTLQFFCIRPWKKLLSKYLKLLNSTSLSPGHPENGRVKLYSATSVIRHIITCAVFIVGQYQAKNTIVYDPDAWVNANGYAQMTKAEVLHIGVMLNRQICRVLETMNQKHFDNEMDTGKGKPEMHTLAWLARDYWAHMHHHLLQLNF